MAVDPGALNAIGISYVAIAEARMALLQTTLDAVIAAENSVLTPILRALAVIFVGRQFLLTMAGELSIRTFYHSVIRILIVTYLVTHNGAFVQYVRDPVFNRIPQAVAGWINGGQDSATAAGTPLATQFDELSIKADTIVKSIDTLSSDIFSLQDWRNSIDAHLSLKGFQLVEACIVGIWLLGQTLLAIILAMGLPILLFELFERTRGFVMTWIGKIIGFAAFGLGTAFILAVEMNQLKLMLASVAASGNVAIQVMGLGHVFENLCLDLLAIAVLPAALSFGGVSALSSPSSRLVMGVVGGAAGGAAGAGVRAVGSAAAGAARLAGNSMRRS